MGGTEATARLDESTALAFDSTRGLLAVFDFVVGFVLRRTEEIVFALAVPVVLVELSLEADCFSRVVPAGVGGAFEAMGGSLRSGDRDLPALMRGT